MPIDVLRVVTSNYWTVLRTGQTNYNAAVQAANSANNTSSPLFNLPLLLDTNLVDERRRPSRTAERTMPVLLDSAFPRLIVSVVRYTERAPDRPTFGYEQGNGCDITLPQTVVLMREVIHRSIDVSDSDQTSLESYLDAAERAARPSYGIPYCGESPGYTPAETVRRDEEAWGMIRTVSRRTVTFNLRPPRSWLNGN